MPRSDITFLVVFSSQTCNNIKPLQYVAVVLLNPTANSDGHEHSKTLRCVLYALCFYSSRVCGQFMGLSEVPSEKKPGLKSAPFVTQNV